MPKVRSQRSISRIHTTSVKPVNRTFAVQDNAVQHLDVGALKDVPADNILHSVDADASSEHISDAPNKKQRRILKHELFIERLEASRAPYSKSHARRLKRKEKEQLAGGLGTLQAALPSIAPTAAATATSTSAGVTAAGKGGGPAATIVATATATRRIASPSPSAKKTVSKPESDAIPDAPGDAVASQATTRRPGQIGEGKGTPLTRSQRRRAL